MTPALLPIAWINFVRSILGPLKPLWAWYFTKRQSKRLLYLMSEPSTHALLEESMTRLLAVMNQILCTRSYLLGERFCLADASLFGQLKAAEYDPSTLRKMEDEAPCVMRWLGAISDGKFGDPNATLGLGSDLTPLIKEIQRTYVPLMQQNEAAYEKFHAAGQKLYNERAYRKGQARYTGRIDGHVFHSVAKTFQVESWRAVCAEKERLSPEELDLISQH